MLMVATWYQPFQPAVASLLSVFVLGVTLLPAGMHCYKATWTIMDLELCHGGSNKISLRLQAHT